MAREDHGTTAIIGAGSWATALSIALGQAGWRVKLWGFQAGLTDARQGPTASGAFYR